MSTDYPTEENAFDSDVVALLKDVEKGDTFAARIETEGSPLGPRTEYVRVKAVCDYGAAYRIKIEMRCEPSADHWIPNTVYIEDSKAEIRRLGPPNITIHAVTEDVLSVDYSPDQTLHGTCDECGKTGTVPVSEDDLPITEPLLIERDGELVTSCCHSEWSCSLD
jgi:hypothetical protein